jgi:hypothetical protein
MLSSSAFPVQGRDGFLRGAAPPSPARPEVPDQVGQRLGAREAAAAPLLGNVPRPRGVEGGLPAARVGGVQGIVLLLQLQELGGVQGVVILLQLQEFGGVQGVVLLLKLQNLVMIKGNLGNFTVSTVGNLS